jgi:vacuolar-type H+-ATPase subunit H
MTTEVEFAGVKFTGGKMFAVITALSTLGGGAWGAFEFYNDYRNMKAQIESYVAPDLSEFDKKLSVLDANMKKLQDSVIEARDYTRDIKVDLKQDVDRLEKIVESNEDKVKSAEDKVRDMIDVANGRFENKRDELRNDNERKMKELEDRLNKRLQQALDNPLAN